MAKDKKSYPWLFGQGGMFSKEARLGRRLERLKGREQTPGRTAKIRKVEGKLKEHRESDNYGKPTRGSKENPFFSKKKNKMILGSKEIDSSTVVSTSQQENIAGFVSPSARREERNASVDQEYTPLTEDFNPGNRKPKEKDTSMTGRFFG